MLVAVCDQPLGTSTFSWRKMTWPFSLPMSAVRRSHSTLSKGEILPSVNQRWKSSPVALRVVCSVCMIPFRTIRVSAIICLRAGSLAVECWPGCRAGGCFTSFYSQFPVAGSCRVAPSDARNGRFTRLDQSPGGASRRPSQKNRKAQPCRAKHCARWEGKLRFDWLNPDLLPRRSTARAEGDDRLPNFSPSLGAKYRALRENLSRKIRVPDHKMLGVDCRKRLSIVVHSPHRYYSLRRRFPATIVAGVPRALPGANVFFA
jgi:hypothetical protein